MLNIALIRLDSGRHDPLSFERDRAEFLAPLRREFTLLETRAGEAVEADLHVIFIASGGSEDAFRRLYYTLPRPIILLADGKDNSLPAALANHHVLIRGDHSGLVNDFVRYCSMVRTR